jgi:hypothetical protein
VQQVRAAKRQDQEEARASQSDPQARIMKQSDGGYAPSYNVQLSTDAAHKIIVGAGVSQSSSDSGQLIDAVGRVEANLESKPGQLVVDGGFTTRENILAMAEQGIDLVGSLADLSQRSADQQAKRGVSEAFQADKFLYDEKADVYRCPAGTLMKHRGRDFRVGVTLHQYRAPREQCRACAFQRQCCPGNAQHGRSVMRTEPAPAVQRFVEKMATQAAQAIYRQRGAIAEFPNAWIKEKLGLRQFRLRGLVKVGLEVLWAALTYNIQQWVRLSWRPRLALAQN